MSNSLRSVDYIYIKNLLLLIFYTRIRYKTMSAVALKLKKVKVALKLQYDRLLNESKGIITVKIEILNEVCDMNEKNMCFEVNIIRRII